MRFQIIDVQSSFIIKALEELSGADRGWKLNFYNNNEYDIVWDKENVRDPEPTEIILELARKYQEEYNALEYQRLRASEYPNIIDQLDILYHNGYDGWHQIIEEIKQKYPKP